MSNPQQPFQFSRHSLKGYCCLFLVLFSIHASSIVYADGELPQLGENAVFNIEQEAAIGRQVYQQLLERGLIETHPLLDRYINDLGARLLSVVDNRVRDYRFFIVRDSSINAFALPGGYIGINVGLILRAKTQHQLASVLAHEIAHVRLRHGMKLMEKAEGVSNATILTILAGLLAGGGSDLGAALVYGGVAGGQQAMINYTRDFEYEADRIGISLLQGADFDGRGMVEFFTLLAKASDNSSVQNIEYLRTHPVSDNRISETEARLRPFSIHLSAPDYFSLFQDYLLYIGSENQGLSGSLFRQALTKIKSGNEKSASALLKTLYQQEGDNFWYGYVYAENLEFIKQQKKAEQVYRQLLEIYPDDFIVSLNLMRLLKTTGRLDAALSIARQLENRYPRNKAVYFELVDIYQQLDESLLKMMAQADYHRLSGYPDQAIRLYGKILGSPEIDLVTESKVKEKLAELDRQRSSSRQN